MLKHFDFKALTEIDDERIATTINHALQRAYEDLADRPRVEKDRTITLTSSLSPRADDAGRLDDVDGGLKVVEKVPARTTKTYRMTAKNGALFFNEDSPDNPDQQTLDMPASGIPSIRRVGS